MGDYLTKHFGATEHVASTAIRHQADGVVTYITGMGGTELKNDLASTPAPDTTPDLGF